MIDTRRSLPAATKADREDAKNAKKFFVELVEFVASV
jgi:hypothetical protein